MSNISYSGIGIYKPFKSVFFNGSDAETAAWSYEVVNLFNILQKNGQEVFMLSPCDRPEIMGPTDRSKLYEQIIIVGGSFALDSEFEHIVLCRLRSLTRKLTLLITDQKLIPQNTGSWTYFDEILTQSTKQEILQESDAWIRDYFPLQPHCKIKRSYTEELVLYGFQRQQEEFEKKHLFYFGGGERGRTKSFFEYVYRPHHVLNIKSTTLGMDNRVSFAEHTKRLQNAFATIVIADELYNKTGFVTPRQYEAWMCDTIAFAEKDYDPLCKIYPADSYLRVNNFVEMDKKIQELRHNEGKAREIIEWQRSQITDDMVSGNTIYKRICKK